MAQFEPTAQSTKLTRWLNQSKEAAVSGQEPGLSVKDLVQVWSPRFASAELEDLVIPRRTMARRKSQAAKLTPEEQDRAFRLAEVQFEADRVFANPEKASMWLRMPNKRLSGQTPLSLLKSAAGAAVVMEMLGQLDHGMYV